MKRDSIAERLHSLVSRKYCKIKKKLFDSGKRCLGEWIRSINKVLRADSFEDLTFEVK